MTVSIIIPTLNEAAHLPQTLQALRRQNPHQIIVADGGSGDGTEQAAVSADEFVPARKGRAEQMNAGAARATGEVLLFLHADCELEDGGVAEAEHRLRRPEVAAGCFTMRVRAAGRLFRAIDAVATARVRLSGIAYGDQGLFLRRDLFMKVGGFPALKFLEDVMMSRRLSQCGRLVVARSRILVSPRRWQRVGLVRQTVRNWTLVGLAALGVHPDRLAAFYPDLR